MLLKIVQIPDSANRIIKQLQNNGFEAFVVGGCVRDSLLGREPHDWDICTNASPEQVKAALNDYDIIDTGIKHGTVTVLSESDKYEVTTYRIDGEYSDHRRPDQVSFTKDLTDDLARRDFTINAMAYNDDAGLVDVFGGQKDLRNGVIRCVGNADHRFEEDALRVLRALRFASVYGFGIQSSTAAAIHRNVPALSYVAEERMFSELCKLLMGESVLDILLSYSDVICQIIQDMKPCVGFLQNNPHHRYTVYEHIARAVDTYKGTDVAVRLALLLHDIGKPLCYSEKNGVGHFYGHAKASQEIAKKVLDGLKVDNATRHDVTELVLYHDLDAEASQKFVKKWLNKIGEKQLRRLIEIMKADTLAQSGLGAEERLRKYEQIESLIDQVLAERQPFSVRDLAVNGRDLIELGIPEGPTIGMILEELLENVINDQIPNEKEKLLFLAAAYLE